jgi:hypothetical protein
MDLQAAVVDLWATWLELLSDGMERLARPSNWRTPSDLATKR